MAKPFLKWAGGKSQLIDEIEHRLPERLIESSFVFVEPFVGSGAVLFWVLQRFPNLKKAVINDVNKDLCNCYEVIKSDVESLILILTKWQEEYYAILKDEVACKKYFYSKRTLLNMNTSEKVIQAALFIFLNKTCFNGLYRVNRKNEFNVPIGRYKKPRICDEKNLRAVSKLLKKVVILNSDYTDTLKHAGKFAFYYLDPPYKPLSKTSSFNSYANVIFDDVEQTRLKKFCDLLDKKGHLWLQSNSDPKNTEPDNNFFDFLYKAYSIQRVKANRRINADPIKRGDLTELLISNF
ncbi:DNA adenine methylase [uncultured Arcticibacterium sp.]|uniref:DNA adenine methylase n=1 Tax=uncultured Arcticibacterium sp. TaxID=2173042 RepID=UPI0030F96153